MFDERLEKMQNEFIEKHRDADFIECRLPQPRGDGKVIRAVYLSPVYKADETARAFFREVLRQQAEEPSHD